MKSLVLLLAAAAGGPRPITPEDYYSMRFVSDPQISPDGRRVAYVVTTVERERNRRHASVWVTEADGTGAPRRLTAGAASANWPRWSPDGRQLAFLSAREGGKTQIHLLPVGGGEARPLTELPGGVSGFQWSPEGARLVCVSRAAEGAGGSDVRHYTRLWYKFDPAGWYDGRRTHLWLVDAVSGAARQITEGEEWNDSDPQWSPEGGRIAFVSDRSGRELDGSRNKDVWVMPAEGGAPVKLSRNEEADTSPRWSPDGRSVAFIANLDANEHPQIQLADARGGAAPAVMAPKLDQTVAGLTWAEGGQALYFSSAVRGEHHLYRVDRGSGEIRALTRGARAVREFSVHAGSGRVVYIASDFHHMDDVYVWDKPPGLSSGVDKGEVDKAGALSYSLATVERFPYQGADGWEMEGFLVKPVGWEAGKSYPMVVSIHGGPNGMHGVGWSHEFQVLAGRGWAVFAPNPRGSSGYGRQFQRAVNKEWGGKAYVDIMKGVEAVLRAHPWIDRGRLGVAGASYGGYMTNWITSHSDLFKAAVSERCISNLVSVQGTRDAAFGHARDFGGDLFQNFELYWEYSPLKHVKNVKTPTLVLLADSDHRTPLEQGEQWYRALKYLGVTAELVIFPRENHELNRGGEPRHIVERLNWMVYWFERFLNGNAAARRPM